MNCDIKDLKTKGVLDESGVKNFFIETPEGLSYCALRQPNGKFTIGDVELRRRKCVADNLSGWWHCRSSRD